MLSRYLAITGILEKNVELYVELLLNVVCKISQSQGDTSSVNLNFFLFFGLRLVVIQLALILFLPGLAVFRLMTYLESMQLFSRTITM